VDRLAASVADAPDIGPLVAQLRDANTRLGELRERRAMVAPRTVPAPTTPSPERIRAYFDDLVSTLGSDPAGARDVLAASLRTVRLVPTPSAYRLELTMAEVCGKPNCGGPLFGLPQTTFRALVSSSRGSAAVRVLRPKRAA
jgi:hypothetical protein